LTDKAANDIKNVVKNEEEIEEVMKKIDAIDKQVKFAAFGKTRLIQNKSKRKVKDQRNVTDEDLIKRQTKKIEDEVLKVKSQNLGRVGTVFKMKEIVNGPKKAGQEPNAIRDPKNANLVVSNEEIKNVTLAYCVSNLTKKSNDNIAVFRNKLNALTMEDKDDEGFEIDKSDFKEVIKKFASKETKSYDFLLKSGKKYQEAMYDLCKRMVENEEFPLSFRKTILFMIWK
jgi:hypothetical protein